MIAYLALASFLVELGRVHALKLEKFLKRNLPNCCSHSFLRSIVYYFPSTIAQSAIILATARITMCEKAKPTKASHGESRTDDSSQYLNSSSARKDIELGNSSSLASTDSNIRQSLSTRDWLFVKAVTNGKVISALTLYGFCSVSMVLVNKSLASR